MFKYFLLTLLLAYYFTPALIFSYFSISIQTADDEYDFIIVGAGTTGLVIANRLTEIPNVKVLVLEAGEEDYPNFFISIPGLCGFAQLTSVNWGYLTVPQKHACQAMEGQKSHWPRGKVVGGSSSLNFMIYTRGNSDDFDQWERSGAEGWSYEDVLPYFKKSENFTGNSEDIEESFHGKSGPLKIGSIRGSALHDIFEEGMSELGIKTGDYNGEDQQGYMNVQRTMYDGVRINAARAFLYPIIDSRRDQLHLLTRAFVKKVEFSDGRAVGVHYTRDGKKYSVRARKEVILSAGSIGTPQIMMLSGVGEEEHLKDIGIPVVANLPGVGSNLQDHLMTPGCFKAKNIPRDWNGADILNPINAMKSFYQYFTTGTGYFADPYGTNTHGFINTPSKNITRLGKRPDLQIMAQATIFRSDYMFRRLYQSLFNYAEQYTDRLKEWSDNNNDHVVCDFTMTSVGLHPYSVGNIRLRSNNHLDHPYINPNYLQDYRDVETMMEGFRLFERIEETEAFERMSAKLNLYSPECGSEKESTTPRSDSFYECYIRKFTWTVYHPVGTAKMGPRDDPMSVVDPRLRVYKVKNLRVADASVMPELTSGNTQAPCYMIGEKVSDMIKEDWNLSAN